MKRLLAVPGGPPVDMSRSVSGYCIWIFTGLPVLGSERDIQRGAGGKVFKFVRVQCVQKSVRDYRYFAWVDQSKVRSLG